jgi:hypothetical protein
MTSDLERRSFVAHDVDGDRYLIVAARPVGQKPGADRPGPWSYRTLDGRAVCAAPSSHLYSVEPEGIRLTTSDPDEPID